MRSIGTLITSAICLVALLAVAIWSRSTREGPLTRSIAINPNLTLITRGTQPVSAIIDIMDPETGVTTPFAWVCLGREEATLNLQGLTPPINSIYVIRWGIGQSVYSTSPTGPKGLLGDEDEVTGGFAQPGDPPLTLLPMPGRIPFASGSQNFTVTAATNTIEVGEMGMNIQSGVAAPPPPSPPPPLPPAPTGETTSPPPSATPEEAAGQVS